MIIRPIGYAALFAGAFLSLQAAGLAQPAPAPSTAAPSTPSGNAAAARVEARIKQLHSQLGITAAEEAQWNRFAEVMRDNGRDMDRILSERAQQFPTMNAVQDMQSYQHVAEAHVQHLQKLVPAFQSLYDSLTPEQKKRADEAFRARVQAPRQAGAGGR